MRSLSIMILVLFALAIGGAGTLGYRFYKKYAAPYVSFLIPRGDVTYEPEKVAANFKSLLGIPIPSTHKPVVSVEITAFGKNRINLVGAIPTGSNPSDIFPSGKRELEYHPSKGMVVLAIKYNKENQTYDQILEDIAGFTRGKGNRALVRKELPVGAKKITYLDGVGTDDGIYVRQSYFFLAGGRVLILAAAQDSFNENTLNEVAQGLASNHPNDAFLFGLPNTQALKKLAAKVDPQCGLKGVGDDFEAYGVSISTGSEPADLKISDGYEEATKEFVNVGTTQTPVVLVLMSSSPIVWKLGLTSTARLAGVLVSSANASAIEGLPKGVPFRILSREEGRNGCGHFSDYRTSDLSKLNRQVAPFLGAELQDVYTKKGGHAFEIGEVKSALIDTEHVPLSEFIRSPLLPQTTKRKLASTEHLSCKVSEFSKPVASCTGKVVASGSMGNSDSGNDAAHFCETEGVEGSCCMYHLYGVGQWYLTDGKLQNTKRQCNREGSDCQGAGTCLVTR